MNKGYWKSLPPVKDAINNIQNELERAIITNYIENIEYGIESIENHTGKKQHFRTVEHWEKDEEMTLPHASYVFMLFGAAGWCIQRYGELLMFHSEKDIKKRAVVAEPHLGCPPEGWTP